MRFALVRTVNNNPGWTIFGPAFKGVGGKKTLYWRCLCWLPGSFCWYWQLKRSQWLMTLGLNTRTSGTGRRGCWRKYSPLCSPKATSSPPTAPKDLACSSYVLLLLFVFFLPSLSPPPCSRSLTRSMLLWQRQKREAAAAFVKFGGCFVFGPWKSRPPSFCLVLFFEALLLRIHSLIIRLRPNEMFLRRPWESFFFLSFVIFFFPRPRHIKLWWMIKVPDAETCPPSLPPLQNWKNQHGSSS